MQNLRWIRKFLLYYLRLCSCPLVKCFWQCICLGPVHTNAFLFSSKTHRSIRVHTIVLMRFRLSTLKHYKTIELHVNSMSRLQTHVRAIFSVIVFILMRFRPFLTVHTNKICMRFCFDPLSRAFSMKMLSVLLSTEGPNNTSKWTRFQTKIHYGALFNVYILLACSRFSDSGEDAYLGA